jgi:hypothetical protein
MCLNCGCGDYDKRSKPSDITLDDVKTAAKGQGMDIKQAAANIHDATGAIEQENA